MRLLIVGSLDGHIVTAGKIALARGAKVAHVDDINGALTALRNGQGADLLLFDVKLDVGSMIEQLKAERISLPVVACGIGTNAEIAVRAIRAGAKEYIPLPPDPELIAAVLAAVANDSRDLIYRDEAMARVIKLAQQIAAFPQQCMLANRSACYAQWDLPLHEALRMEGRQGVSMVAAEGAAGAARFAQGAGRHGQAAS